MKGPKERTTRKEKFIIKNVNLTYTYERVEAIFDFLKNELALSDPFVFTNEVDKKYSNIAGKTFSEIDNVAPSIISRISGYELCIVFMDTDSPDIINELFIRLNSGVAVNTA